MKKEVYKLPVEFLSKLKKIYPLDYSSIVNTFLVKKNSAFRINYLKTDLSSLRNDLRNQRVKFKEFTFPKGSFLLNTPLREFQKTEVYRKGLVYVQNLSSMLVPLVLAPQDGDLILDLCAAPGAKTTQIVSLAPQVRITAIEKNRGRYYKLLANLKIQGVKLIDTIESELSETDVPAARASNGVEVFILDSIWVRKKFPECFDKILADVPCSAEGRFLINDPKTFKYWKQRKVKEMVHKQKKLLHSAFFALKQGGILVYSTCTFSPEENEGVIDWFIDKFKNKVEILPIKIPLSNVRQGLAHWEGKKYSSFLQMAKRIIPTDAMEGFFMVKLRKTAF
ncbi:MAG: RsmB/NOP family class I SAM-dependent RNA methyltransferase [Candidatus Omnitrophota bacterium]